MKCYEVLEIKQELEIILEKNNERAKNIKVFLKIIPFGFKMPF